MAEVGVAAIAALISPTAFFPVCQRRSKNRPLWRSKSRPLMLRQVQSKGPRSGPFAFGRFDGSVFVDGGLVLLRPAGSGATATG